MWPARRSVIDHYQQPPTRASRVIAEGRRWKRLPRSSRRCPALRRVVYRPQPTADGTKSIYLTPCVRVWRGPHCPTRPGPGKAAEPGPTNVVRPKASRSDYLRGALSRLLTRGPTAWPAAPLGHSGDRVAIYDAGPSCSLAVRTTASGVNPNFDCRALRGADAPNVDIATTAPVDPT